MDRLSFLRNSLGALAATIVGSRLEGIADVEPLASKLSQKRVPPEVMYVQIPKGLYHRYDIIAVNSTGQQYYVKDKKENILYLEELVSAESNREPISFEMHEIENDAPQGDHTRICSAYSEV